MTAFSMPCWKSAIAKLLRSAVSMAWVGLGWLGAAAQAQTSAEVSQLRAERAGNEVFVSATVAFELPNAVEEALLKGVPVYFLAEAELYYDRWYWYDKRISSAQRQVRLAYQPLTRRWRVNIGSGMGSDSAQGLALNQSFETLAQAMAAVKQISQWKVADLGESDLTAKIKTEFRFRLDLSQLPRPFQIGAIGQSEWDINASARTPLRTEGLR
jgi:hypothetical protein